MTPILRGPLVELLPRPLDEPVRLVVGVHVLDVIESADQKRNGFAPYSRDEVGGYLFVDPRQPNVIAFATDAVHEASPTGVILNVQRRIGRVEAIGCWHTQPGCDLEPSRSDLLAWFAALIDSGCQRWYSLVATRDSYDGWWRVAGYVTRPRAGGRGRVEPIEIERRGW